jgi:hypothetical protein
MMIATISLFAATALAQIAAPSITSLTPSSGPVGTQVTIFGSGFTSDNSIDFGIGGALHTPSQQNGTVLYFTIPENIGPCSSVEAASRIRCMAPAMMVRPGTYEIVVVNAQRQKSNMVSFMVTR